MMCTIEDLELTPEELSVARDRGLSLARCRVCGRATLYATMAPAPATCGRFACMRERGEIGPLEREFGYR